MSDAEAQRDRSRWRSRAIVATAAFCAAIGIVSLARQATKRTVETGFDLVDASGGIEVRRGGAAESAGLRTGDRLLEIDGSPVDDVFSWNARVVSLTDERPLTVRVVRGESVLTLDLPVRVRRGADPLYYYLALVGFFFLATATIVAFRTGRGRASTRYFAFSVAVFSVLAVSDSPAGTTLDLWLFIVDRLGRLTFPVLFVILCAALAESGPARRGARALLWLPAAVLGAANLGIHAAASRGWLRDPLALWTLKDRSELLFIAVYLSFGLVVLWRAVARAAAPQRRYQLRWTFGGAAAGFGPPIVLAFLPLGLGAEPSPWHDASLLTMAFVPVTLSSALFRYRPGDLEAYLRRAIRGLSVAFFTFAACSAAWVLIDRVGAPLFHLSDPVVAGMAALIGAVLYPKIRHVTHLALDRLTYGGRHSFRRTLLAFGRELNAEMDLETLVARFEERTRETLDLTSTLLLVRQDREGVLRPVVNAPAGDGDGGTAPTTDAGGTPEPSVPVDSPLIERIRGLSYVLLEDLAHAPGSERLEALRARGMQYLFPMKVKGEIRGVLAAGPRREGQPLSREDVELLVALCGHAAAALESARLVAQLQSKVNEVERLRRNNEDILESSQVGILVVDPDGTIQAMNEALVEIYGASRKEALGRTLAEVFPLPLVRRLARASGEEESENGIRRLYRHPLTNRRGRKIVVNVSQSNLAAGARHAGGHVITIDDVTDQVKLEEQLQRQDRLASIGLLASGVAHEVNTPLTGISSYTQMLLAELDPSDPRYETLRKIERQTFRAASIVNSLLNFTREGSGAIESIAVPGLVEESLALFEPQLLGGSIRVELEIEPNLPPLAGHRGKLQQVLLNLLLNARDAIAASGTIRISAHRRGGRLVLEVADDGEGIAEEHLARVFDPFFTTKPRGRGTGLGLSLSYSIVHEHKGEISVESRAGEGSVFTIDLPFERRDAARA